MVLIVTFLYVDGGPSSNALVEAHVRMEGLQEVFRHAVEKLWQR